MNDEATLTTDWSMIALALAQRVKVAVTQLEVKSDTYLLGPEAGEMIHWRDYMADGLEMIPGVKVDREIMHTMGLPRSKRAKSIAQIKANRAAQDKIKKQK